MNTLRTPSFIKIKHTIQKAETALHLPACRQMIENCNTICSKEEVSILKEYYNEARSRIMPGESLADEIDNIAHIAARNR